MKILHSADWHLDSPLTGFPAEQTRLLRQNLLALPGHIAKLCLRENCDLMLLCGDLFDGPYSRQSLDTLRAALEEAAVPVFICPGNHDPATSDSPWTKESWPANVHIFTSPHWESVDLPNLNCRVYGAGYTSMDCPPLLEGFRAEGDCAHVIAMIHGDPTTHNSPCCPVTHAQVMDSALDYLALGHIHKGDNFLAGSTLCAWPGCPMGRGFDETGAKGVLLVTLEESAEVQFLPLPYPGFYDLQIREPEDPVQELHRLLPPVGNEDFYRITFTGPSEELDLQALRLEFSRFPNLILRDHTTAPVDIWRSAGEDSLEGAYFAALRDAVSAADPTQARRLQLAAKLSRQILDGQEVTLP